MLVTRFKMVKTFDNVGVVEAFEDGNLVENRGFLAFDEGFGNDPGR